MNKRNGQVFALSAALAMLIAVDAAAQGIFLAARLVGKVVQMSQEHPSGGPSYDSATVILNAPAPRVYDTAVRYVKDAQPRGISVTAENAQAMWIQFTNGQQVAGIRVTALNDSTSQLLISSAHTGSQPNAAALVTDSVMRVCAQMNVRCTRE